MNKLIIAFILISVCVAAKAVVITQWNFEAQNLQPNQGSGSIALTGNTTNDGFGSGNNSSYAWSTTGYPAQSTNNLTAGIYFDVSTVGYNTINVSWSHRHSNTSANRAVLYYTLDKTAPTPVWQLAETFNAPTGDTWYQRAYNGNGIAGLANNANLAFKIVSAFANTGNTAYMPSTSTSPYASTGKWRFDNILVEGTPTLPALSINADLTEFYATVGQVSAIQNYSINGYNLTSNLLITAPAHFKLRVLGGIFFSNTLLLTPLYGSLSITIEVTYQPNITGVNNGDIVHSSMGITPLNLTVTGRSVLPEPSAYPTGLHASNATYYQMDLNWTDPIGTVLPDGYCIKGSKVHPDSIAFPVDGVVEESKKLTKYVNYGVQSTLIWELEENMPYFFKIYPYTNSGAAINYKNDSAVPVLSTNTTVGPVGSTLNPGDIAFVEFGTDSPDRFAFVLLKDMAENTKITFTDQAWDGNAWVEGETTYYWRGIARAYAKGEVIHIVEDTLYTDEGIINPNLSGFSNSGDQILAYQGAAGTPNFIAGFSNTGWLNSGTPTNNSSYLPATLNINDTALGFSDEVDNGCYNGAMLTGSPSQLRAAIHNPANWLRNNSLTEILFPDWNITVMSDGITGICLQRIDNLTFRISWDIVSGAASYKIYTSANPDATYPEDWNILNQGLETNHYDLTINSLNNPARFYRITAELN